MFDPIARKRARIGRLQIVTDNGCFALVCKAKLAYVKWDCFHMLSSYFKG